MPPRAFRPRHLFAFALVLLALQLAFGQAAPVSSTNEAAKTTTATAPESSATPAAQDRSGDLRIAPGDLLALKVFGVPDMDQEARVTTSGDILVTLLGPVHVDGLTNYEAQALLEAKLRDAGLLKDPHVTLFTKEYSTQGITVLGEVQRPGIYPLLGSRRLFDAISAAGGTTPRAGREVSVTHRDLPDKPVKVEVSSTSDRTGSENIEVFPGDTIFVSKAGLVYVVGDVAHPSGFLMENDGKMTVLQALALAGGTNGTAALNKARIIRKTPAGLQEVPIKLKPLFQAKAQDIALQNNDILFVPNSRAKAGAKRGLESIVQITTGLAVATRW